MSDASPVDVVVVGAGLAGLTAARTLARAGRSVRVLDKGRGVGGRMATRRIGNARIDHGAQFFTTRGREFTELIHEAIKAGAVREWCRGFDADGDDGYPRYCGADGMTRLCKWLAEDLDVRTETTVVDLRHYPADAFVLTAPVPQSLAILSFSHMLAPPALAAQLATIRYHPVIALLATLDQPPDFPEPGGVQQPNDPVVTFAADNQRKGVSPTPAMVLHAAHQWSADHWTDSDDTVIRALLERAAPWLGGAKPVQVSLQRWRYAGPVEPWPEPFVRVATDPHVILAGDAFNGPKVEGAFNSGLAAARALLKTGSR